MLPHDPLPNFVHLGIIVVTIFQLSSSSPHISIFFIIIKACHINLRAGFVSFTCPLNYVWSYAFVKSSSQLILLFLLPITCNGNIYTICIGVWFLIFCVHDPGSNSLALIMGLMGLLWDIDPTINSLFSHTSNKESFWFLPFNRNMLCFFCWELFH